LQDTANGATNVSASPNNAGSAFQVEALMRVYTKCKCQQVFVPSENNQDTVPYNSFSVSGQSVYANQVANFNTILFLLANSPELGKDGIATNGNQYNTLSVNPILVKTKIIDP